MVRVTDRADMTIAFYHVYKAITTTTTTKTTVKFLSAVEELSFKHIFLPTVNIQKSE